MGTLHGLISKAADITDNSKEVKPGSIFFAIRGTRFDGHTFIGEVLKKNPLAVVVEENFNPAGLKISVPFFKVKNTRKAFAEACRLFFGKPDERLKIIGVTGTNGKTSTTYIAAQLLKSAGLPTGIIGTVEYRFESNIYGKGQTTPHPKVWFKTLARMAEDGAKAVAAEISSHALEQFRVWGTRFEGIIFTNLTQDHLDYHGNMEGYFEAKRKLFTDYFYRKGVVNGDDTFGKRLKEELNLPSFGLLTENEYRIKDIHLLPEGSSFVLETEREKVKVETPLVGEFQVFNLAGALALMNELGFSLKKLAEAAKELKPIPGRFEVVIKKPFTVVVDYAHTPDALEKLLKSVRKLSGGRVITVFGAGGNRDRSKRPKMGAVAERYSDIVILTSDNPRFEDPGAIIEEIRKGMKGFCEIYVEPDRRSAIELALKKIAKEGDTVVIAGKGHEDYQEIKGRRIHFDDREEVLKVFDNIE